jgi:DNA-binding transcriptional LysR family regulator
MAHVSPAERLVRDLDWNLLRAFLALAEAGSVTAAAARLSLKQPSVSSALKRLEERVGARLIDRGPGHFALTPAGERLRAEAEEVRAAVLRLTGALAEVAGQVTGAITVALASHVISPLFDRVLGDFHRDHPAATFAMEVMASRDALQAVQGRRASFALCLAGARPQALEAEVLYREYFGFFCGRPHPLFGRSGLTLADLAGQAAVSFQTDRVGDVLEAVTAMRRAARLDERVVGCSANLEEVRRMVEAGLGIGPLPLHAVTAEVAQGRLWQLPPDEGLAAVDVHLVWNPKARANPAEAELLARLRAALAAVPLAERTYQ